MRMKISLFCCLGFLILSSQLFSADIEKSPRALVHLLEYLSADYAGAVENRRVVSASEYAEQVEFIGMANEMGAELSKNPEYSSIGKQLAELKKLILEKADAKQVAKLALDIKADVLKISKLEVAPMQWPSLKNGQALFSTHCSSCHGNTGHGDGPEGKGLDPSPRNFHDDEHMRTVSAFHAYNVVRLGIPGTGMRAFTDFSDKEIWDLSFYVLSLRFQNRKEELREANLSGDTSETLQQVATLSDEQLTEKLSGSDEDKKTALAVLRLKDGADNQQSSLPVARANLKKAFEFYRDGKKEEARQAALMAYLQGIEPIEPQLKAVNDKMVSDIEIVMAAVRASIEKSRPIDELTAAIQNANVAIDNVELALKNRETSSWISFSLASGIVFREGFEAVLMIIAILGVIRAAKAKRAARFVHFGWVAAVALGIVSWFFSGWLIQMSGAQREITEALTSIIAVLVLLYMGFWLHSKTEIKRWTAFIDGKVKTALEGSSRWALFGLAFLAVFREAFETVLFMRAIWIEGGSSSKGALILGIVVSFITIFALAWAFLKYSVRIPIRQLFAVSSWIMVVLAVILTGKGIHSFQEAGTLSVTPLPFVNIPFFGIYPTVETVVAQSATILICIVLWQISKKPISNLKAERKTA